MSKADGRGSRAVHGVLLHAYPSPKKRAHTAGISPTSRPPGHTTEGITDGVW